MGNVFKERSYKCECGMVTKEYVWDRDLDKTTVNCSKCSNKLTNKDLIKPNTIQVAGIRTPTKNR